MYCPICGHQLRPEARFCPLCGTSVADRMPVQASVSEPEIESEDHSRMYLILDVVMFILITFTPWIGSYFTSVGGSISLPSIAIDAVNIVNLGSQYAPTIEQLGFGDAYNIVVAALCFIAFIAGITWLFVVLRIFNDFRRDVKHEVAPSRGGRALAIVALVVQIIAWCVQAIVMILLSFGHENLAVLGTGALQTTGWVWVSIFVGMAANYLRGNPDKDELIRLALLKK